METVDDEEIPDSGSDINREDYDDTIPTLTPLVMNTVEPECPDQIHGSLATGRTTAVAEK